MQIGDWVLYEDIEIGRIKGFHSDGDPYVVYSCDGKWWSFAFEPKTRFGNYTDYTGQKTPVESIKTIYPNRECACCHGTGYSVEEEVFGANAKLCYLCFHGMVKFLDTYMKYEYVGMV